MFTWGSSRPFTPGVASLGCVHATGAAATDPTTREAMRDAFHEDLDTISDQLVEMTRLAGSAMGRATTALLDADLHLAESVIAADEQIDRPARGAGRRCSIDLLARQQPVATDLRMVVTGMRMSADLERMGDLARHVAKVARLRYPESAVPADLRATILQMGQVAERIVAKAGSVIAAKDVEAAMHARARRRRRWTACTASCSATCSTARWTHGIEAAVDMTLRRPLLRAVRRPRRVVAHRVVYLVTGEWHTDAELDGEE